jgi:hypothetical protein
MRFARELDGRASLLKCKYVRGRWQIFEMPSFEMADFEMPRARHARVSDTATPTPKAHDTQRPGGILSMPSVAYLCGH